MQDADEPVGELAQASVVVVAAGAYRRSSCAPWRRRNGLRLADSPSTRAPSNGPMPGWDKMLSASSDIEPPAGVHRVHGVAGGEQGGHPWGTVEPWVRDYPRAWGVLGTSSLVRAGPRR